MSYGYVEAYKNSPDSTSYARRIYDANGRLSRSLLLQRNIDSSVSLLYKPRIDVGASKPRYKIVTYYPNDKVVIDLDDLPISPNIVRILKEYLPIGLEAKGGSGSYSAIRITMNGWQNRYLDADNRSLTFMKYDGTWRQFLPQEEVDPDPNLADDPEKELAYAREKAGLLTPPPANFPSDILAWNNGSLRPPYAIPVHYVEEWEEWDEKNPPGWVRTWSIYMDSPSQMEELIVDYKDRGVCVLINKNATPGRVIAAFNVLE